MRTLSSIQVLLFGALVTVDGSKLQYPPGYNPNQYPPGQNPNQYPPQVYGQNQGQNQYQYPPQAYGQNQGQNQYQYPQQSYGQNQPAYAPNQYQPNQYPQSYPQASYGPTYSPPVSGPRMGGQIWRPKIGQRVQVILDKRVAQLNRNSPLVPDHAEIWDVDLFDTTKETIDLLHSKGKRVMCYLSVGGSESWRPDFTGIPKADLGDIMPKWKGERYLNLRSPSIWNFMQNRIRMAYQKGCDALDPDNVDPFNDDFARGGGFNPPLTEADSIDFLRKISNEAARHGMSIGMKNAESILPNVTDFIQFAVNEECSTYSTDEDGCWQYTPFLQSGKPVFHFEYVNVDTSLGYPRIQSVYKNWANLSSPEILDYYCFRNNFGYPHLPNREVGALFSTAIKKLDLGGWVMYCDGTYAETPTAQTVGGPDRELDPGWEGRQSQRGGKKGEGPELVDPQNAFGGGARQGGGRELGPEPTEGSSSGSQPWWNPLGWFS